MVELITDFVKSYPFVWIILALAVLFTAGFAIEIIKYRKLRKLDERRKSRAERDISTWQSWNNL